MPPSISLSLGTDSFSLALGPNFRLDHSPRRPLLKAGRGQASYTNRLGSFRIKSRAEELRPYAGFEVLEASPRRVRIRFPGLATLAATAASGLGGLCSLGLAFEDLEGDYNHLVLAIPAQAGDRIYGCGEQYSFLDLRGRRVPLWCEEQGVGRGPNAIRLAAELAAGAGGNRLSTYYPVPAFLSSAGWSCACELRAWARFDFRRPREHRLLFWEIPRSIVFETCPEAASGARSWDPAALVGSLSLRAGRQSQPPAWAFKGLILGVQGGTEEILAKAEVLEKAGAPLAGLWAQDWCGRRLTSFGSQLRWNWETDPGLYPDLAGLVQGLAARGLHLLGYINPFLAPDGPLYAEASARGLCAKDGQGRDYLLQTAGFPAAVLDLTKPETRTWIKGIIKANLLGQGFSGWMADFGEYLPTDAVLDCGEAAELVHNAYPVLWAQVNAEAVAEASAEAAAPRRQGGWDHLVLPVRWPRILALCAIILGRGPVRGLEPGRWPSKRDPGGPLPGPPGLGLLARRPGGLYHRGLAQAVPGAFAPLGRAFGLYTYYAQPRGQSPGSQCPGLV